MTNIFVCLSSKNLKHGLIINPWLKLTPIIIVRNATRTHVSCQIDDKPARRDVIYIYIYIYIYIRDNRKWPFGNMQYAICRSTRHFVPNRRKDKQQWADNIASEAENLYNVDS